MVTLKLETGRLQLRSGTAATPAAADARPSPRSRRRIQAFRPDPVAVAQVFQLLRAAFEAMRPGCWGRAAASPLSWQELAVYAVTDQGIYRYDEHHVRLELLTPDDLRAATGQDFMATAPASLVYVVNFDAMQRAHAEEHGVYAGPDAGGVIGQICNCCAKAGLGSVVHGLSDRRRVADVLGLKPSEHILVVQSVGYPAQETAH